MAENPIEKEDKNPSLHLHEVLAKEFAELHDPAHTDSSADDPRQSLRDLWSKIHALEERRAALCISGGGIRSATFALGVLQGLARCGLLKKFHYLSTVSGGGYIGGWLTAWMFHSGRGLEDVTGRLARLGGGEELNPEPREIQNLRSYSNYLSPRPGLLSADTWTLIATYLRNLILTWLVFIPLLAAALTIPWLYASVLMIEPAPYTEQPLWWGVGLAFIAIVYMGLSLPSAGNTRRSQGKFLIWFLTPLVLSAILMTTHWAWYTRYGGMIEPLTVAGVTHPSLPFICLGVGLHFLAWLVLFVLHIASRLKDLTEGKGKEIIAVMLKQLIAVFFSGAIGGWLSWVAAQKVFPQPVARGELYCCFAVPIYLMLFYLAITIYTGLCSRDANDEDREWWGRASGWILIAAVAWAVVSALVVFGPLLLSMGYSWVYSTIAAGGLAGIITILAGLSKGVPANAKETTKAGPIALILSKGTAIAAMVFAIVAVILIVCGLTSLMRHIGNVLEFDWNLEAPSGVLGRSVEYLNVILYTPICVLIWLPLALAGFGIAIAFLVDPNKFSLHAMYRDRLIRAYLGASHKDRKENPFTGFDQNDNIQMHELWGPKNSGKLFPVINMALNLVHGKKLAWQDRKATSFTVSPLHCGSCDEEIGYRKTKAGGICYGGKDGISLGTAITISGAAASPNMGYHSSPFVTFILTLLNVRLGAWLGNPGKKGDHTFQLGYPRFSVRPIIAEAFGLTDDTSPYVYLSDGGHFENLGLYEMVLRRCHYIVVSDAGQDPQCSFADLGEAVRKIRIDLGISIEFTDTISIYPRSDTVNEKGRYGAVGRIHYSMVDGGNKENDGILIYLKPACYGNEPRDIYEYFKRNIMFPHESTADQFFTESQFESYRMLGAYTMSMLCRQEDADFPAFIRGLFGPKGHLGPEMLPSWLEELLPPLPPKSGGGNAPPKTEAPKI